MREPNTDKFSCPKCGSTNTRSFRAISQGGTSAGSASGYMSGFGTQSSQVELEVRTKTDEARLASRPEKQWSWQFRYGLAFAGPIPFFSYWIGRISVPDHELTTGSISLLALMSVCGMILLLWGLGENKKLNSELDERQERWPRMWRCNRCANSYEVIN